MFSEHQSTLTNPSSPLCQPSLSPASLHSANSSSSPRTHLLVASKCQTPKRPMTIYVCHQIRPLGLALEISLRTKCLIHFQTPSLLLGSEAFSLRHKLVLGERIHCLGLTKPSTVPHPQPSLRSTETLIVFSTVVYPVEFE